MPPLTFFCARAFLICCLFRTTRGANHRGENMFVVLLFSLLCAASGFLSVLLYFVSPPFCFLCACVLVLLPFWSSDETCLFLLPPPSWFSASARLLLFYLFLATFCQSSSISLHSCPSLSIHRRFFFFSPPRLEDLLVPRSSHCLCPSSSLFLSLICVFLLAVSVLSFGLPGLCFFFRAKIKRSLLSAVCCLHSESFSSGSSPHAARLTARVKRTDPPRIANVLRGNLLNYAHCGGEDVHNSGIKLLKVMQYLAPRLPAVYRRRGSLLPDWRARPSPPHPNPPPCARVGPETDGRANVTVVSLRWSSGEMQDDGSLTAEHT